MDVAAHCTHSPRRNPAKQYYIVDTALGNGWIAGELRGRQYRLYIPHFAKLRERLERRQAQQPTLGQRLAAYKIARLPTRYPGLTAEPASNGRWRLTLGNWYSCTTDDFATALRFASGHWEAELGS